MKLLSFILPLLFINLYSQSETEVIGINYSHYSKSNYNDKIYNSSTQKGNVFINYGHDLGKKNKLFYHASFKDFKNKTQINYDNILQDVTVFPKIADYSLIVLAAGMKNELKNNWKLTNILSLSMIDDFSKDNLNINNYFRTFSFLTKKKTENFTYGLGIYFANIKNNKRILPVISLNLKNDKRGFKLFFPRELKLWQKLNDKSYLELKSNLNSDVLIYNNYENLEVKILSLTNTLMYNYILNNKYKVKAGIGLPYREYEYQTDLGDFITVQKGSVSFNVGFSYVVFQNK